MIRRFAIILASCANGAVADSAEPMASFATAPVDLSTTWVAGFKQQIARCYNPGQQRENAAVRFVEIGFQMGPDARPVLGSFHFVSKSGESGEEQAYRQGRLAVLRCGATGYDLPLDLFSQWQFVTLSFFYQVPFGESRPVARDDP